MMKHKRLNYLYYCLFSGAESTLVMVGAVDFLKSPAIAFVRLAKSVFMPSVTEIPLPVRFLFLLLGPPQGEDYHEVGRSISTLMSNKVYCIIQSKMFMSTV